EFLAPLAVLPVQLGRAAVEVLPALVEGLGTLLDPVEFLVEPLFAVGETGFPAFEVAAQFTHLVLDRPDFLFDFAAALRGLFGLLAGPVEDAGGLGLGAGTDVFGFGGDLVELAAVGWGYLSVRGRMHGPAPHDAKREDEREQPDHHERKRQSAAHGHPFPSIALGAPLCCDVVVRRHQGSMRFYALDRAVARRVRSSPDLPFSFDYAAYILVLLRWLSVQDGTTTRCREVKA